MPFSLYRIRVIAGIVAIVAALGVVLVILGVSDGKFSSGYKVDAVFTRAGQGMYPGNAVKVRGVNVGTVTSFHLDTDDHVVSAIEAGATGYLLKDAPRAELLRAVQAAAKGEAVLAPAVASRLMGRVRAPDTGPEALSQRELEVLGLVAGGNTNKEAAARLFISEATVKTHLLHIYAKLGVGDRAAAVAEAFNRGLLTPAAPEQP